jgi:hypothetical protein
MGTASSQQAQHARKLASIPIIVDTPSHDDLKTYQQHRRAIFMVDTYTPLILRLLLTILFASNI